MFEALSRSKWKWMWWFLLLCCVSALMFLLAALLGSLFGPSGGPMYYVEVLALAGFGVGIIGAVVSFVVTFLRRHVPPVKRAT